VGAVLVITFVFVTVLSSLRPGGSTMNARRRARLIAGFSCIGLAALVGLIGYLKLSLERDVNRQIPYLASAGMALVLLAVVGGAFIVAEQLRQDDERMERLEDAVRTLAGALAPDIEAPPRRRARSR
jgi:membrane protein YdbS with pleckstrin-like domain